MTDDNKQFSVLIVDDEPSILTAYKRNLHKEFNILTAESGKEALEILRKEKNIAVIVCDMRMPNMDGLELLELAQHHYPDIMRAMLTGNADQKTAIDAINKGEIFRFHTKPCTPKTMAVTLRDGIEQHRLKRVEKDLLEHTLKGAVKALTETLSLVNPEAFGRTTRIARLSREIGRILDMKNLWYLETLGMLSQIGCIILPEDVLKKIYTGQTLTDEEDQLYKMHPEMGHDILSKIPRMKSMANALRYQMKNLDGSGYPVDEVKGDQVPTGARILHAIIDYDEYVAEGMTEKQAFQKLLDHQSWYDQGIVKALGMAIGTEKERVTHKIMLDELELGMTLVRDVRSTDGKLLIGKGLEVTKPILEKFKVFSNRFEIQEPLYVNCAEDN